MSPIWILSFHAADTLGIADIERHIQIGSGNVRIIEITVLSFGILIFELSFPQANDASSFSLTIITVPFVIVSFSSCPSPAVFI